MSNIKVSVIGCEYLGGNLARNFSELESLYSVCDFDPHLAAKTAQIYGVPAQPLNQILESTVDGVVITTPIVNYFEIIEKALKAEKHVFVGKSLTMTIEEAKKLYDLSIYVNRKLMMGYLAQYHPVFVELEHAIALGKLGRIQYIYSDRLNVNNFQNEQNILQRFAPHDISMILALTRELPEIISSTGSSYLNSKIHDVTITHMTFKNGIKAHVFVSWLHPYKEQKLVIAGDLGTAVFDDNLDWNEKLKFYPFTINCTDDFSQPERAQVINLPLEMFDPLKLECKHFLECIDGNNIARTDGLEGLRVLQVLDAAQQSLHSHTNIVINQKIPNYFVHESAIIDNGCHIGDETKIWHFSHIIKGTKIGKNCVIGQNVMIGPDVIIGDRCKIQNNVSIYEGVTLEDGVFCGPSCVFTNVHNPRAEIERADEFKRKFRKTYVERGATIGANATIVCGNRIGKYSLIGAGAVITKDVKSHAVMVGNPAKQIGWVSHAGEKLGSDLICPREGRNYCVTTDGLIENLGAHGNVSEKFVLQA